MHEILSCSVGAPDQWTGCDVEESQLLGCSLVVAESFGRDVFDHRKVSWRGPKVLTQSQEIGPGGSKVMERLKDILFSLA